MFIAMIDIVNVLVGCLTTIGLDYVAYRLFKWKDIDFDLDYCVKISVIIYLILTIVCNISW